MLRDFLAPGRAGVCDAIIDERHKGIVPLTCGATVIRKEFAGERQEK